MARDEVDPKGGNFGLIPANDVRFKKCSFICRIYTTIDGDLDRRISGQFRVAGSGCLSLNVCRVPYKPHKKCVTANRNVVNKRCRLSTLTAHLSSRLSCFISSLKIDDRTYGIVHTERSS